MRGETNLNARWLSIVTCLFFIWKLLSRDFTTFGYAPTWVMYRTPALVYQIEEAFFLMDLGVFAKIACFHWIHFFLPYPSEFIIAIIWVCTIMALLLTVVFGRGPNRLFILAGYVGVMYLWGFIFSSGQDIDAVFLPMGLLFAYLFSNHDESFKWSVLDARSVESSTFIASAVMVFVIYYFGAGINKLTDVPLIEWFQYDLYKEMQYYVIADQLGSDRLIPSVFHFIAEADMAGVGLVMLLGVPAVYLIHLLIIFAFKSGDSVFWSFLFYATFHFLAFGVGISFVANLLVWFAFLNLSNIIRGRKPIMGYK